MTATYDQLTANVDGTRDLVNALNTLHAFGALDVDELDDDTREVLDDHGIDPADFEPEELFDELLDAAALEIYGTARVTYDTVDVGGIVVVVGTGGPHIEFEVSWNESAEIRGYWGTDTVTKRVSGVTFGDYLAEIVGGWDRDL